MTENFKMRVNPSKSCKLTRRRGRCLETFLRGAPPSKTQPPFPHNLSIHLPEKINSQASRELESSKRKVLASEFFRHISPKSSARHRFTVSPPTPESGGHSMNSSVSPSTRSGLRNGMTCKPGYAPGSAENSSVSRLTVVTEKAGHYAAHCDTFRAR